jgi:HTH-like domain
MRFGHRRLTAMLVREGIEVNHKRVYRLYREEGLVCACDSGGGSAGTERNQSGGEAESTVVDRFRK